MFVVVVASDDRVWDQAETETMPTKSTLSIAFDFAVYVSMVLMVDDVGVVLVARWLRLRYSIGSGSGLPLHSLID